MSRFAIIKNMVLEILNDGQEHTTADLKERMKEKGIIISTKDSVLRSAIFQLRNSGVEIGSRERGIYQINKNQENKLLDDFFVLEPETKENQFFVYVHDDGKMVLNSRLNNIINSRNLQIQISKDGERMALISNVEPCHRFTKNGYSKNIKLLNLLKRKRILFPVKYEMQLDDKKKIWIGKIKRDSPKGK